MIARINCLEQPIQRIQVTKKDENTAKVPAKTKVKKENNKKLPDLVVDYIFRAGNTYGVYVENIGEAKSKKCTFELNIFGLPTFFAKVGAIEPDHKAFGYIGNTNDPQGTPRSYRAEIDIYDDVEESDETNNGKFGAVL